MANKIRSISVIYQAFTDQFEKSLDRAEGKADGFTKKILAGVAGFVAARASIDGFTESVEKLIEIDRIAKSLEVNPNFVQGLSLAADDIGESFDRAKDLIQEFNVKIGEAIADGAGTAVNGLKLIGVELEELEGLNVEQKFLKIANALKQIEDPQRRIFAAGELFGGVGEDLIGLLESDLDSFIQKAQQFGGVITPEQIQAAKEFNRSMQRIEGAVDAAWRAFVERLAPSISDLANTLTEFLVPAIEKIGDAWSKSIEATANAGLFLKAFFEDVQNNFDTFFGDQGIDELERRSEEIRKRFEDEINVKLGVSGDDKQAKNLANSFSDLQKDLTKTIQVQTFTDAAAFQSSAAFEILNPDSTNNVQNENANANKQTAQNTQQINDNLKRNKMKVNEVPLG